jgi:hypothetical protein
MVANSHAKFATNRKTYGFFLLIYSHKQQFIFYIICNEILHETVCS